MDGGGSNPNSRSVNMRIIEKGGIWKNVKYL